MADRDQRKSAGRPQSNRQDGHGKEGGDRRGPRDSNRDNNNSNQNRPRSSNQNRDRNNQNRGDRKDQKREKKPFVPWLGEERPTKGPILDLETYKDKQIYVSFVGGREISGTLAGFDSFMNLVLEDVTEYLDNDQTRHLGNLVARGPLLQSIAPMEGTENIPNPF